jgi:hypothetical protein
MKKYLIPLFMCICFYTLTANAIVNPCSSIVKVNPKKQITMEQILTMSPKEFQKATGVKLSFTQRLIYKLVQKKLKKQKRLQNPDEPNLKADRNAELSLGAGIMTWIFALGGILVPFISILSLPFALIALITGATSVKKTTKKTKSVVGMVLGGLYLLILGIGIILISSTL